MDQVGDNEFLKAYERFCPSILSHVMHEIARAEKLHGTLPTDVVRAHVILSEEVGEAAEAALELTRDPTRAEYWVRKAHLREELVQIAAVAFRAIENLDKEKE